MFVVTLNKQIQHIVKEYRILNPNNVNLQDIINLTEEANKWIIKSDVVDL